MRHADRLIWALIGATALAVTIAALAGPFRIDWRSYAPVTLGCAALIAVAGYYIRFRPDPKLASALTGTAQIAAFAAVGAPLSYIAASAALPLWDAQLMQWDRDIGLDWMGLLSAMNTHADLHPAFRFAYTSFSIQATATVLALAFANHLIRLRHFLLGFMLATFVTIAISALMPAQGVWGHLHLAAHDYPNIAPTTQRTHLAVFLGLRDGSFRELMAQGSEGIITFPSLHAALGLLFIFAMWPVPYLRWAAAALNVLMIAATPVDGGHYFSDVIAGLVIASACWMAAARCLDRRRPVAASETEAADAPSIVPDAAAAPDWSGNRLPQPDSRESLKAG